MNEQRSLITVGSNTLRLQIEEMPTNQLKRNTRSPRNHPDKQIVMLARNIDTFGFLVPCLIDEQNRLLTGAARLRAAERLGMKTIPVIRVQHLEERERDSNRDIGRRWSSNQHWKPGHAVQTEPVSSSFLQKTATMPKVR